VGRWWLRLPVQIIRLPFDVLFLTWDLLRVGAWGMGNLVRGATGAPSAPFDPCFSGGMMAETDDGELWSFAPASKYGTKAVLRLLFSRLCWYTLEDGRAHLCWRGSGSSAPTTVVRFLLTAVILACLWGGVGGAVLWKARHHLPLPGGRSRPPVLAGPGGQAAPSAPDAAKAAQYVAQAAELEKAGRNAEARDRFREAAAADSRLLEAQLGLGRTAQELGLLDEARKAYARAVELDSADPRAVLGLARMLHLQGADGQAVGILRTVASRNPEHAEAQALLAACLAATGEVEAAAAASEKALELAPGNVEALTTAAEVELRRGNLDPAEARYRQLIDQDTTSILGRIGLARILRLRGKTAEAESTLRRVLAEKPGEVPATEELIEVLVASSRAREALALCGEAGPDQAPVDIRLQEKRLVVLASLSMDNELCTACERLLERSPGNAMAHLQMGAMFLRHGLPVLAVDRCRKALTQQPGLERAFRLLISAQLLSGDLEPAREVLERYLAVRPQDLEALFQLADYHRRKGDPEKAAEVVRQALSFHPGSMVAHAQLGQLLFEQGDLKGSLAEFREAHRLAPDDPKALNNLAAAMNNAGEDRAQALAYAEQAYKLEPSSPRILDTLAWIHACRGEAEKGLPFAQTAVALQPSIAHLRYHYGAILAALGRKDEAKAALTAALTGDSGFFGAAEARALLEKMEGAAAGAKP